MSISIDKNGNIIGKWSFEDFKDVNSINKIPSDVIDKSDEDGLTPLGFAVLNNVDVNLIAYFIFKHKPLLTQKCDKCNRTPLQLACMAMNNKAIDLLFGRIPDGGYIVTDGNGKLVKVKVVKKLSNNNIYENYRDEIFEASKLPKSECLLALLNTDEKCDFSTKTKDDSISESDLINIYSPSYTDNNDYIPLLWSTKLQNYDSIKSLLDHDNHPAYSILAECGRDDKSEDNEENDENEDSEENLESSFVTSIKNKDIGSLKKFANILGSVIDKSDHDCFIDAISLSINYYKDYTEQPFKLLVNQFKYDDVINTDSNSDFSTVHKKVVSHASLYCILISIESFVATSGNETNFTTAINTCFDSSNGLKSGAKILVTKKDFTVSSPGFSNAMDKSIENNWDDVFILIASNKSFNTNYESSGAVYKSFNSIVTSILEKTPIWEDALCVMLDKEDFTATGSTSSKFNECLSLTIGDNLSKAFAVLISKPSFIRSNNNFIYALNSTISTTAFREYFSLLYSKAHFSLNDISDNTLLSAISTSINYNNKQAFDVLITNINSEYSELNTLVQDSIASDNNYYFRKLSSLLVANSDTFNAAIDDAINKANYSVLKLLVSRVEYTSSSHSFNNALTTSFSEKWNDIIIELLSKYGSVIYSILSNSYSYGDSSITVLQFVENNISNNNILKKLFNDYYSSEYIDLIISHKCYNIISVLYSNNKLVDIDIKKIKYAASHNLLDNYYLHNNLRSILIGVKTKVPLLSSTLSSNFFWAYGFSSFSDEYKIWYNPSSSLPLSSQMTSQSLVQLNIDSSKYTYIRISDGSGISYSPLLFRLFMLNNNVAFATDIGHLSYDNTSNGIVVKFADSILPKLFELSSTSMYNINNDREIVWNNTNPIVHLLSGEECVAI